MGLVSIPGVSTVYNPPNTVLMSVANADVPPDSLVYNRTVAIGDTLSWTITASRDGGGSGIVSVDGEGVPTITPDPGNDRPYGTYAIIFSFKGGASETNYYAWGDTADIEALFTATTKDANGYTVYSPNAANRLLYVDTTLGNDSTQGPSGNNSDWYTGASPPAGGWKTPSSVNAYATIAAATAAWSNGDWLLLKRGETFVYNAQLSVPGGNSNTDRTHLIAYGSGTGNRPIITPGDLSVGAFIDVASADDFINFDSLEVYATKRDPDHVDFAGYGFCYRMNGISIYSGGLTSDHYGMRIENCYVHHFMDNYDLRGNGNGHDYVLYRCISGISWNEYPGEEAQGVWSSKNSVHVNQCLFTHSGWLTQSDDVTYDHSASQGDNTCTAGTTANVIEDTGQNWSGAVDLTGTVVKRNGDNADIWVVTSHPTSTTSAVTQLVGSTSWASGDTYRMAAPESHGQATIFGHNFYTSGPHNMIIENSITHQSGSTAIKTTADNIAGPNTVQAPNLVYRNNLYIDDETGASVGGNAPDGDGPRFGDVRIYNNFITSLGEVHSTDRVLGFTSDLLDWDGGMYCNNIFANIGGTAEGVTNVFGVIMTGTLIDVVIARNVGFNLGEASGSDAGDKQGLLSMYNDVAGTRSNIHIINNLFQNHDKDLPVIGAYHTAFNGDFTCSGNKATTTRTAAEWARVDDSPVTLASFNTSIGGGFTNESVTFVDDTRTIETYQTSRGGTATEQAFIDDVKSAMLAEGAWDKELDAHEIIEGYFRPGFTEA